MSNFQNYKACRKCNRPLQPGAKFCSGCGTPCSEGDNTRTNMVFSQIHWSLILCYILLGVSIIYSWVWRDLYNWYVDLFKDYGNHLYWMKASQVFDVVRAVIIAVPTIVAFHFESQNNKRLATVSAALIAPALLVAEFIYSIYMTQTMGEYAALFGMQTSVSPFIIWDLVYPALLVCFIQWNNRLKKRSIIFPILNVICFLLLKRFDIFVAIASTLGLLKYWVRRDITN